MIENSLVVDREGLAKKIANRPKAFILYELLQNSWDANGVSDVRATAEMLPGRPVCKITVEDDAPDGFTDMRSIFTLFRDSEKAPDPTKRGRFEMGEKLVLAIALEATVRTTKGVIRFEGPNFKRSWSRNTAESTAVGSIFTATFKMNRQEFDEVVAGVQLLAVPNNIKTYFNGTLLKSRTPVHTFETTLQTIRVDDEGALKTTQRKTEIKVYEVLPGETAHIYEMGIPIVETGDKYHYDVQQRVPINWERNNVPPSYLRALRVEVLNAIHGNLSKDEATSPWVSDAIDDERCVAEAIKEVVTKRFGERAVIYDPSDKEGTKIAMSQNYTVIPGGAFSSGAWKNIKASGAVLPAGQVTPSPRVYSPDGEPENVIPEDKWTPDMKRRAEFAIALFNKLLNAKCYVVIVREPHVRWDANFGRRSVSSRLCLNYGRLGKSWFAASNRGVEVLDLIIHEFVHFTCDDHLSNEMHETATRLGAQLANLALDEPEFFR